MLVTYSDSISSNKSEAIANLSKNKKWLAGKYDYDELLNMYRSGRSLNIRDNKKSEAVILDCDDLTEKQLELLQNKKFLTNLAAELGAKRIDVLDSASHKKNKKKVFLKKTYNRNIVDNIDLAYRDIRLKFFQQTGILADSAMDAYTQITFRNQ